MQSSWIHEYIKTEIMKSSTCSTFSALIWSSIRWLSSCNSLMSGCSCFLWALKWWSCSVSSSNLPSTTSFSLIKASCRIVRWIKLAGRQRVMWGECMHFFVWRSIGGRAGLTVRCTNSSYATTFSSLNLAKLMTALKILSNLLYSGFWISLSEKSCRPDAAMRRILRFDIHGKSAVVIRSSSFSCCFHAKYKHIAGCLTWIDWKPAALWKIHAVRGNQMHPCR